MGKVYRIHEFAELAGVTVKTLHHYDRLGLLKPRRTDAGYRLYADRDLERLEQIVALKFLGLPLKQIKVLLDRGALELPDALRLQREALEQKQQLLARAVSAIRVAEKAMVPGQQADPAILKKLIEVIGMQNDIEVMKQYYSEEAWAKRRVRYEQAPSQEWMELCRDVEAALGEDPASEKSQGLATRWLALAERDAGGDPQVLAGETKAWADRKNWPASLQQLIARHNAEAIGAFIGKAIEAQRKKYFGSEAWAKLSARDSAEREQLTLAWHALFLEVREALGDDPASERAQALAVRWVDLAKRSSGGDPDIRVGIIEAWKDRRNRPAAMQRYMAAFNVEEVAEFIGKAIRHRAEKRG